METGQDKDREAEFVARAPSPAPRLRPGTDVRKILKIAGVSSTQRQDRDTTFALPPMCEWLRIRGLVARIAFGPAVRPWAVAARDMKPGQCACSN